MKNYLECIWQAHRRYMWVSLEVHKTIQFDDCYVIVEIARIKLRMNVDAENVELYVGIELTIIVDIPLPKSYPKLFWSVLLYTMSGGQYV